MSREEKEYPLITHKRSFVGPFFYIGGSLYAYKDPMWRHDPKERFHNAEISHFDYFDRLHMEGDYGNYPRGRVIYDAFRDKFLVYLDKSLMSQGIKDLILKAYNLEKRYVLFRRDEHYTHDDL